MPPSWMTPANDEPLVTVSVWLPRLTRPIPAVSARPPTEAPELVCEMSSVASPDPSESKPTYKELAIEPAPFSARVAPRSICVTLV